MLDETFSVAAEPRTTGPSVLQVSGELSQCTAPRLRDVLDTLPVADGVVLDMTDLTFCDSSGISTLVAACQRAEAASSWLSLVGLNEHLTYQFRIVGLGDFFTFYSTVDEAVTRGT